MDRTAYADAGVDVAAGEHAVELFRKRLSQSGHLPGEFGSLIEIPTDMRHPVLITSTDGIGTKTDLARRLGRYDTIGQDLVAMCADDVVCHGAAPRYFLDYIAVGRIDASRIAQIVASVSDACGQIGCELIGGETAEHPGVMASDDVDLAGFCIGLVERQDVIDATKSREGDSIIGLASSGLHSNGYSLVRRLVDEGKLPLTDELLTPTRLYAAIVLDLIDTLRRLKLRIGGMAHITGGGLRRNLPRAVPDGMGAYVYPSMWAEPPIFESIAGAAGITDSEMRATFNCGVGFAIVVEQDAVKITLAALADAGVDAWDIGTVRSVDDLGGERYVEA
jgi:phosphoribosylformylglycinamidine cyclo-ligase